jgi:hypothetical protein
VESAQVGRIFENLVENAYTAQSRGRLTSYVPLLDAHGVDRAVSLDGGPPLFVQVKGHLLTGRPGERPMFTIPAASVGHVERWLAVLAVGTVGGLHDAYIVPGPDLAGICVRETVHGMEVLKAWPSSASSNWSPFHAKSDALGERLMAEAGPPEPGLALISPPLELRSQEEGRAIELSLAAALLAATDELAIYQPAPDIAGRDLLIQLARTPRHLFAQVKGTVRQDAPDLAKFQVRRRTFTADPRLLMLFAYRDASGRLGPVWAVPAPDLAARAAHGDEEHISFEAHIEGPDTRWGEFRINPEKLAGRVLTLI